MYLKAVLCYYQLAVLVMISINESEPHGIRNVFVHVHSRNETDVTFLIVYNPCCTFVCVLAFMVKNQNQVPNICMKLHTCMYICVIQAISGYMYTALETLIQLMLVWIPTDSCLSYNCAVCPCCVQVSHSCSKLFITFLYFIMLWWLRL